MSETFERKIEWQFILTFIFHDWKSGKKVKHIRAYSRDQARENFFHQYAWIKPSDGKLHILCCETNKAAAERWEYNGFADPSDGHEMQKDQNRTDVRQIVADLAKHGPFANCRPFAGRDEQGKLVWGKPIESDNLCSKCGKTRHNENNDGLCSACRRSSDRYGEVFQLFRKAGSR